MVKTVKELDDDQKASSLDKDEMEIAKLRILERMAISLEKLTIK